MNKIWEVIVAGVKGCESLSAKIKDGIINGHPSSNGAALLIAFVWFVVAVLMTGRGSIWGLGLLMYWLAFFCWLMKLEWLRYQRLQLQRQTRRG